MFYVHLDHTLKLFDVVFVAVNRRLDEWVGGDRVDLSMSSLPSGDLKENVEDKIEAHVDGPERKLTRNQKRKHDEINHVQKVSTSGDVFEFAFSM